MSDSTRSNAVAATKNAGGYSPACTQGVVRPGLTESSPPAATATAARHPAARRCWRAHVARQEPRDLRRMPQGNPQEWDESAHACCARSKDGRVQHLPPGARVRIRRPCVTLRRCPRLRIARAVQVVPRQLPRKWVSVARARGDVRTAIYASTTLRQQPASSIHPDNLAPPAAASSCHADDKVTRRS